ncbi:glutamate racemase [Acerihabitans sp. TG2]|uniref:glutamate racemase n=1 Tax=Acerihabitans sp. TG2 TaxID=3096008 RepID=UPI002B221FF4|nr:glutamate racemase [Acerihabitans sp. TG2]MEA9390168.1 glutamate racemase [Acerihabitans sp. TG2]
MVIACLHTAASNISIFDTAAKDLGISPHKVSHVVMPHLLAAAEKTGGMTSEQRENLTRYLQSQTPFFDAIVITCSTLGPIADRFDDGGHHCPVYRTDRMLAEALQHRPGKSVVLYAAESTLDATTALFCSGALLSQNPEVIFVPDAWKAFTAGNNALYISLITDAIQNAYRHGAENVALAQVSMTPAAQNFSEFNKPMTSPHLALRFCFDL